MTQGQRDGRVYLVADGTLAASVRTGHGDIEVGSCGPGDIIGELAMIGSGDRTASVRAVDPAEVFEIDAPAFQRHLDDHPGLASEVADSAKRRLDIITMVDAIVHQYGQPIVAVIPGILDAAEWIQLDAGQTLVDEGDEPDAIYLLVGGRLVAEGTAADGSGLRGEIGRGEVVGELALFDRSPRSATVRAVRASTLIRIDIEAFEALLAEHPRSALALTRTIVERIGAVPAPVRRARSLALVICAPSTVVSMEAVENEVNRHGPALTLTSERVDALLGIEGAAEADASTVAGARFGQLLHESEAAVDHVVYVADPRPSAWTRHVLHSADTVIVIGSARPAPAEVDLVRDILSSGPDRSSRRWLALCHDQARARPDPASSHPLRREVAEIHHLRPGDDGDLARLIRLGIGVGTGLVLGGGGARGFAHLGAVRALRERGVPIDRIGGTSMGAIMAALAALHQDDTEMADVARRQFRRLFDYTVPLVSLVKAKRITSRLSDVFQGREIEDLWIPFFCISTNLTEARAEVHDRGDVVSAVRASIAIPGVLPPVPQGDELLVDGGVLNNLPANVMRADPSIATVIAADVTPPRGPRARHDYGLHVSGLRALASAASRRPTRYPSAGAVLMRSMIAGSEQVRAAAVTDGTIDLHLSINVRGVGLLQFDRLDEVVDLGYHSASAQIDEWLADSMLE